MPYMDVEVDENGPEPLCAVVSLKSAPLFSALGWRIQPIPEKETRPK